MASGVVCGSHSRDAAMVGVAVRIISFPSPRGSGDWTGDGVAGVSDHEALAGCLAGPVFEAEDAGCPQVFDADGDGDVDIRDFGLIPFGVLVDRSYSAVNLIGEGARSAIIRYDAPD
jgi:hypothetical protein